MGKGNILILLTWFCRSNCADVETMVGTKVVGGVGRRSRAIRGADERMMLPSAKLCSKTRRVMTREA
jgi:hypothetical protein